MQRHIELAAWGTIFIELTPDLALELTESGLVVCRPTFSPGQFEVAAGSKVGVSVGTGWQLHVRSHLEIAELMFLLSYSRDANGWKEPLASYATTNLFDAVAAGFSRCANRALRQGVVRGYRRVEEQSPVMRGRLLVRTQLARGGLPTPLDVARDEYDEDVIENQFIVAAARTLLRVGAIPAAIATALRGLLLTLDSVTPLAPRTVPSLPLRTRLNAHYWPALVLADLILRNTSVSSRAGTKRSVTFAFELHKVFEEFLETALRTVLGPQGFEVYAQSTDRHLDAERAIGLRPDIVVAKDGRVRAIVDAKFKHRDWPKADAYQMLAYLLAFDVERGFLVTATGSDTNHQVTGAQKTIALRSVRLDGGPASVLNRVQALAGELAAGVP